jgi:hypothetical protein
LPKAWNFRGAKKFTLSDHYCHSARGIEAPRRAIARSALTWWVLARSQYRVKPVFLGHVEERRRAEAIQLEVAAWRPFAHTAHYVMPQPGGALLVAWDRELVESAQAEAGVNPGELEVYPESALRQSRAEGVAIRAMIDGVEATIVASGATIANQWWPDKPDSQAWMNFQRAAGLETRFSQCPEPLVAEWMDRPVGYAAANSARIEAARETWIIATIALVLAIPTLWYANNWRLHAMALRASEARLAATEQELDSLLGARSGALTTMARLEQLHAEFSRQDQLALAAAFSRQVSRVTKIGDLQLSEWDWRDSRLKVTVLVNAAPPSAIALIKALEANPLFRDVQVVADGNRLKLEMRIEQVAAAGIQDAVPANGPVSFPGAPKP